MAYKTRSKQRYINVPVSDETYEAAKQASDSAGVFMRTWVERAIIAQAERDAKKAAK
jgi:hypothetical protein